MNTELMNLFAKFLEKQDILSKLTADESIGGYNYSEIHTIAAIGDLELPNVTNIANAMNVTKGAISKITKKLQEQQLIESYQMEGNKQKIFFKLSLKGQSVYDEHKKRHNLWLKRDDAFLQQFDETTLLQIEKFMRAFNEYLNEQIDALGGASQDKN